MDYAAHLHREILAFESAARVAADADEAALVPTCPGWSVSDLVLHRIPADRLQVNGDAEVLDRYGALVPPV